MAPRFLRRIGPALVYLVVTSGVAIGASEVAVRLLGIAPRMPNQYAMFVPDPVLPHRPRPDSVIEGRARSGEFDFHYAHNALGYRDREHAFEKPPGTFRILGLGDSFTYGAGASSEATFLARLERALNERPGPHPTVEVVNAGIPSFFPEAERLLLEHEGLRFAPDLVIVAFVPNDVIDTYRGLESIQVLPNGYIVTTLGARLVDRLGPIAMLVYEHSHAARIAIRALLARTIENEHPVVGDDVYRAGGFHEGDWVELLHQYDLMAGAVRQHGADLVIVHLPAQGPWDERHAYPAERLASWAARAGALFVDTLPALRSHPHPERLYWRMDSHPTEAGHALIAAVLLEALTREGLVP